MDTIYHDKSPVLAGAAMQLAIQNGLHMFSKRQDFTRNSLRQDQSEELFRAKLWSYCKIVCQSVNCFTGLQPFLTSDAFDREQQHKQIIGSLPRQVYYEQKLHQAWTNSIVTLMASVSAGENELDYIQMRSLMDIFDNEIQGIGYRAEENLQAWRVAVARLYIRVFEFYSKVDEKTPTRLLQLFSVTRSLVELWVDADEQEDFVLYSSHISYRALSLAGCSLLRLARCDMDLHIDLSLIETLYFECIRLLKRRSLQNDDVDARGALLLTQLWRSQRVFRQQDGTTNSLRIRLRNRGPMSINYDCYWYWVVEFRGQSDPYSSNKGQVSGSEASGEQHYDVSASQNGPIDFTLVGDLDQLLPDFTQMDGFWPPWEWSTEFANTS